MKGKQIIRKGFIKDFLWMTLGISLLAVGIYFFKIPNGFATGGVSGMGTVLGHLLPKVSPATWIAGINLLLLILGFLILGWKQMAKTIYCSLLFSAQIWLLEFLVPLSAPLTDQPFLELIVGVLVDALGAAMVFYAGASSGGTDVLALILKKFTHLDVGKALLCVDALIVASAFFVFDIATGLFSLLGLFIKAFLVDGIIESIDSCKYFIVITQKPKEVGAYIMEELHHGVTAHVVKGEYTGEEKTMIHTVCKRLEAYRLRSRIRELDESAFMIITTTSEIIGRGFRSV